MRNRLSLRAARATRIICLLALPLACAASARAAAGPVIISDPTSTRAVAFTSPDFRPQPFPPVCETPLCRGRRTRVMLFVMNLALRDGVTPSAVAARAEDGARRRYDLAVEYVGPVVGHGWMSVVIIRLGDDVGDVGDLLVGLVYNGTESNRVRVAVGHFGGGPPDDEGARPAPAPPFTLGGFVRDGATGLGGALVTLGGPVSRGAAAAVSTAADGSFAFNSLAAGGPYTLTFKKPCYSFSPLALSVEGLYRNTEISVAAAENRIDGRVLDSESRPLAALPVTAAGAANASAQTDPDGRFSFTCLAPGDHTVTPTHAFYNFTPSSLSFAALAGRRTAGFTGTLKRFTVGGRAARSDEAGIAGVAVTLEGGGATRTATTGADGCFSFPDVVAGGDYTITASRANYDLSPAVHAFDDLAANRTADFTGVVHHFRISGRVTTQGQPLGHVHVELTGSRQARAIADDGGNYSFDVPAEGDYTVTPSARHFYAYTPAARSFPALAAPAVANFSASPVAPPATPHVLEWDGSPRTVDYDNFFNRWGDMGHFFWEFWAMPGENAGATYLLSDGYGGAHALLFGFGFFGASEPGRYQLYGNVWNGTRPVFFGSDEGPAPNEWGHLAVGWDGQEIVTYFNGVPVGRTPFAGPRREGGWNNGAWRLLIGGSDHNNLVGRIAQVRGFDETNPREEPAGSGASATRAAFAPETVFRTGGQVLSNYFTPTQIVPDNSAGLFGVLHNGRLRGTPYPYGLLYHCEECPRPQFVVDPTAPDFANATDRSQGTFNPPAAPPAALAYDSFSRRNSTYALGTGGLGQTEGGSAGKLVWQSAPATPHGAAFGILNERAVALANGRALAWVTPQPAPLGQDIRVRRRPSQHGAGLDTGLCFRVADADNYFFAYTDGDPANPGARLLTVGYVRAGARTELAALPLSGGWTELRVVTHASGSFQVYAGDALVFSSANDFLAAAAGAGLYHDRAGLGLSNRWDDFTIYAPPAQQARALGARRARRPDAP